MKTMIDGNLMSAARMDELSDTFKRMCGLYREWNERINVISRKDTDAIFEHHILHSLCITFYLEKCLPENFAQWNNGPVSVLDAGCGGGFPGIPLAAFFPNVQFTLCDSIGKKIKVASAVAESLGLKNVECVQARVEQLSGHWDYVVSRAVTSLDNFLPWVSGRYENNIFYLKGGDLSEELDVCSRKFRSKMPSVHIWNINEVVKDDYFEEKLVVNLGNCQK